MKKWLVALLVILALIILIAPGIVGRMAERNIEESMAWAEQDSPGVLIEQEQYERGWFSSVGRHRITVDDTQFADAAAAFQDSTGNTQLPSLIVDTELDHGPLPGGALSPGLARTVSTFQLDPGDGELQELPGTLTSVIALDGTAEGNLVIGSGSHQLDDGALSWEGVNIDFTENSGAGVLASNGTISAIRADGDGEFVELDGMTFTTDHTRTDYGISVGDADIDIGRLTIESDGTTLSIESMEIDSAVSLDDDRFSGDSQVVMNQMSVPGVGEVGLDIDMSIEGADAASLGAIVDALQEAQSSADPAAAFESVYADIEGELQTLMARGFGFDIGKMNIALPQGMIASSLEINVPEAGSDDDFSWGAVLLGMSGSFDLRIPASVYEMAAMMNPQAGAMVAMGLLRAEGDDYVMEAQYEQGLVNVNGAPMPLPIPLQ